jgi:glutathione synthase/RimK-type ligase-like ATP-grasp enzyme
MQKSKLAVQVTSSGILPDDTVMLGETFFKSWKIPRGQSLNLKFGAFKTSVKAIPVDRYKGLRISPDLAQRMGVHSGVSLRLHYRPSSQTLALGPLIGVLVSRDYPHMPDKPFGAITMFCKELVEAGAAQGAYSYFFTPDQITGNLNTLEAWVFEDGWRKRQVPVPDVVNNRLTSRKLENKPEVQHFLNEAKTRRGTQIFNEKFLDKSEVFDALKREASLARYLPESHTLRNFAVLKSMCDRHGTVFLKPVKGSLGKGIIRISRHAPGGFLATSTTVNGTLKQSYATLPKLFSTLTGKMKAVRYQIQQGLSLIEIGRRPVDFRALVQKNATGAWGVTSIVARIAGGQHFVSNLARGGTLATVKEALLKSALPMPAKQDASTRLKKAALDIAKGIEATIPAQFGELGVDLALDASGRVWLLEVNSKPSKNDNTPLNETKIRPSVRILVQYARHLAGF